ncbi:hypothetical protein GGTG_00085 [Gaeumannomyces tritici R3-111a-1]|uniref:Uncharacterized protein n=1 Tax=Gaeumannomyces tritici (strain R3-111a-1) TaxID=644352 RepID=J3NFP0_GAET3|nr:hypothetical protein GGTG_00085 [Gaeumannomyces tritici R3-111a-1]EJT80080.1 hypothetical protein GGTG_00085 [Gaeumannomyces tritici R3-111a-1]
MIVYPANLYRSQGSQTLVLWILVVHQFGLVFQGKKCILLHRISVCDPWNKDAMALAHHAIIVMGQRIEPPAFFLSLFPTNESRTPDPPRPSLG